MAEITRSIHFPVCSRSACRQIRVLLSVMLIICAGCAPFRKPFTKYNSLEKMNISEFPQFHDALDLTGLEHAIGQSLLYFNKIHKTRVFNFGKDRFDANHMKNSLKKFLLFIQHHPSKKELNRFIRNNYAVYRSVGKSGHSEMLFTGYYEPTLKGSLTRDDDYVYPLYSKPADLVSIDLSLFSKRFSNSHILMARVNKNKQVVPYFSRQEINSINDFKKRAMPIAWLKNPIDRFFLEIQGSGKILLKQGGFLRVHYLASNGRRYRSIGRYLIAKKEITKENMSMQSIRRWLDNHPDRMEEVFNYNPSFVFFKKETGGPFGCLGVAITPIRSIATDRSLFPEGALCFIKTRVPLKTPDPKNPDTENQAMENWSAYSGFVLNQDTGGAIRGPGRADLFYGNGRYARFAAGHMNHRGKLYFLVLKK